ncbi:PEP-CTERM sorting domain-containing protein [Haloferula sp.]|uniref:PEP-CTERM sorting domain-containing protein n=1 Tax=Haloferula sp. TaxID=2497595 RepID=UPI00329CB9DC
MKRTRYKTLGALAISLLGFSSASQAVILAEYNFNNDGSGTDLSATTVATGVTGGTTTDGAGFDIFTNTGLTVLFTSGGVGLNGGVAGSTKAIALTDGEYFSITISATNTGTERLDISTLDFNAVRSSNGSSNYFVRSSLDAFASDLADATIPGGAVSQISLGSAFDSVETVEFRFYLYNRASTSNGSSSVTLDDIEFNGTVVAIPEPSSAMLILGGAGLALLRRRRA